MVMNPMEENPQKNTKQKQIQANNDHTPTKGRLINPTTWPTYNESWLKVERIIVAKDQLERITSWWFQPI